MPFTNAAWAQISDERSDQRDLGNEHVTGMRFKDPDDSEIEADLVMMAVGIRPNAALARCPPALRQRRGGERHHAVLRSAHLCHRRVR